MNDEVEAFLEHFGRKGQKWGVKTASPSGSSAPTNNTLKGKTAKAKSGANSLSSKIEGAKDKNLKNAVAEQKGKTLKNKTASTKYTKPGKLSNKQLKDSVDRMRLEKDYAALVAEKKQSSTGRRLLSKTLKTTEDVAFNTLDVQGKRIANELIGGQLDKSLGIESRTVKLAGEFVKGEAIKAKGARAAAQLVKQQSGPRSFVPPAGNTRKPAKGARRWRP